MEGDYYVRFPFLEAGVDPLGEAVEGCGDVPGGERLLALEGLGELGGEQVAGKEGFSSGDAASQRDRDGGGGRSFGAGDGGEGGKRHGLDLKARGPIGPGGAEGLCELSGDGRRDSGFCERRQEPGSRGIGLCRAPVGICRLGPLMQPFWKRAAVIHSLAATRKASRALVAMPIHCNWIPSLFPWTISRIGDGAGEARLGILKGDVHCAIDGTCQSCRLSVEIESKGFGPGSARATKGD